MTRHLDYDGAWRPTAQKLDNLTVAVPTYDANGELSSISYPSGTGNGGNGTPLGTVSRDASGRTTGLTWRKPDGTTLASDSVTYSQSSRVVDQSIDGTDANQGSNNFGYDSDGPLVGASVPGHSLTYGFAATGGCGMLSGAGKNSNRTAVTDNSSTTTYCYDAADKLSSTTDAQFASIVYDGHGNATTLGGQALAYDGADRHVETISSTNTVRYTRDALDRIVARAVNGVTLARYGYGGPGDSPGFATDATGAVIERTIALLGGVIVTKRFSGDIWSYSNIHGDIRGTANAAEAKQGVTLTYDPYGQGGAPDNAVGNLDYGWLGQHQRPLDHEPGTDTIEMGARPYVPAVGRFLTVDSVESGSANDYEYGNADSVNQVDTDGTFPRHQAVYCLFRPWQCAVGFLAAKAAERVALNAQNYFGWSARQRGAFRHGFWMALTVLFTFGDTELRLDSGTPMRNTYAGPTTEPADSIALVTFTTMWWEPTWASSPFSIVPTLLGRRW